MDTSGEYTLMCKQAEEIQKIWELSNGDFYFNPKRKDKKCIVILGGWLNSITTFEGFNQRSYTWLPRQDQIQLMMEPSGNFSHTLNARFKHFVNTDPWSRTTQYERAVTYEQLWLAFLMKQKYNKRWDGETWIEIQ